MRRTAERLHRALGGATLTASDFRVPALATVDLRGRHVLEWTSRGKHLLLRLSGDLTVHTHLRMEGSWRLFRTGRRWGGGPAWQVRLVLVTPQWQAVGYRLPVVEVLPTTAEERAIGHLGPDVLGPDVRGPGESGRDGRGRAAPTPDVPDPHERGQELPNRVPAGRDPGPAPAAGLPHQPRPILPVDGWDESEALRRLLRDPHRPVVEALLDQRNLAGLGNLWVGETCYLRGVYPWTPVGEVNLPPLLRLSRRMMQQAARNGLQVTTGDPRPSRSHWVYGRAGSPCLRCGTPIRLRPGGGDPYRRETWWCPRCQPGG